MIRLTPFARYGQSKFNVDGNLKEWEISEADIGKIAVPTLLINGRYDEANDECMQKYHKNIADVSWTKFEQSSHTPHLEERQKYLEVVGSFLTARR